MKTRFGRALIAILSVAALAVGLSSCSWLLDLFGGGNTAPTVTLTASSYNVTTGTQVTLTASANDADGDPLTYTWYLNEVLQSGATGSVATWTPTVAGSFTLDVVVSDGTETGTDNVSIYVTAANTAPTVSLTVDDSTVYSDDIASFTASAYDADYDTLTYNWYVNDSLVSTNSGSTHSRYWLSSSYIYPEVHVVVSDGNGGSTQSNTVYMTITPAASFRVVNNSGASVYDIQTSTTGGVPWSADYLGGYALYTGYMLRVTGLPDSYDYAIRAFDASSGNWTSGLVVVWNGYYRTFTLTASSWNMSSATNASLASPRALGLPGLSGAKIASTEIFTPKAGDAAAFNPQIGPISAEESDPNHDPALGFGVQF